MIRRRYRRPLWIHTYAPLAGKIHIFMEATIFGASLNPLFFTKEMAHLKRAKQKQMELIGVFIGFRPKSSAQLVSKKG